MTIAIILVVLSALILLFLILLARGQYLDPHGGQDPSQQIRFVDIDAFRNLVDPAEADYLRSRLPSEDYVRIQRERLRAAIECVMCAARNAAVLLKVAEGARNSSDPATAAAAEKLVENAIQLRLYAIQVIPRLYAAMLLPTRGVPTLRVAERYEQMTRQIIVLGVKFPLSGNL
jgi:hypothetical protein